MNIFEWIENIRNKQWELEDQTPKSYIGVEENPEEIEFSDIVLSVDEDKNRSRMNRLSPLQRARLKERHNEYWENTHKEYAGYILDKQNEQERE